MSADRTDPRAAAFLALADRHLDAAYRLARAILRDTADAEDATHDAIVQRYDIDPRVLGALVGNDFWMLDASAVLWRLPLG